MKSRSTPEQAEDAGPLAWESLKALPSLSWSGGRIPLGFAPFALGDTLAETAALTSATLEKITLEDRHLALIRLRFSGAMGAILFKEVELLAVGNRVYAVELIADAAQTQETLYRELVRQFGEDSAVPLGHFYKMEVAAGSYGLMVSAYEARARYARAGKTKNGEWRIRLAYKDGETLLRAAQKKLDAPPAAK